MGDASLEGQRILDAICCWINFFSAIIGLCLCNGKNSSAGRKRCAIKDYPDSNGYCKKEIVFKKLLAWIDSIDRDLYTRHDSQRSKRQLYG